MAGPVRWSAVLAPVGAVDPAFPALASDFAVTLLPGTPLLEDTEWSPWVGTVHTATVRDGYLWATGILVDPHVCMRIAYRHLHPQMDLCEKVTSARHVVVAARLRAVRAGVLLMPAARFILDHHPVGIDVHAD